VLLLLEVLRDESEGDVHIHLVVYRD